MKTWIHPASKMMQFVCSCGATFENESTMKDEIVRIEICSKCHPQYTGEQKILKTWAVDKFYARMKKTETLNK